MNAIALSQEDFSYILRCCRRLLVNSFTNPDDLRHFLVIRLAEDAPALATAVESFDEQQMKQLRDTVAAALKEEHAATAWW